MLDLIKYISLVKNGDMEFVKELLVNGFNHDLINDLINLPAANLNDIQDCFSISIDGQKLSKKIRQIKKQVEFDHEIDHLISMGVPFKIAKKYFGISTNEYSNKRKLSNLSFDDKKLQVSDLHIIFSTYNSFIDEGFNDLESLKKTHLSVRDEIGLNVSIKKLNEVCCEYD